ncbi:MAG: alpha/beta fold hydrolase [Thalassolituus sp.]
MSLQIPTNTPLKTPPADYCPEGAERWFTIPGGKDAGKKLFYYDLCVGDQDPEATLVLVHGNPETSYTYRHIRDALITSGRPIRIIAMDHIGFGLSDQADFEMIDMHHSDNLIQLVRHLDLTEVTLGIHDWGGPIGIGAFIEDPYRIRNLVVMNTSIFPMPKQGFTYTNYPHPVLTWALFPRIYPAFAWGGVAATAVSNGEPQGAVSLIWRATRYTTAHLFNRLPKNSPEYVWSQSVRSVANARSSMRNVKQTPRWGYGYHYTDPVYGRQDNTDYYRAMQERVPEFWRNCPAAGFFGQWDPCGKDEVIAQWHEALPCMKRATYRYPEVGHFVEEYKGSEIAEKIIAMNFPE